MVTIMVRYSEVKLRTLFASTFEEIERLTNIVTNNKEKVTEKKDLKIAEIRIGLLKKLKEDILGFVQESNKLTSMDETLGGFR